MRAKANQAARLAGKGPRPRVFVEIGRSPLYSAGPGSFIDDLIRRAGGENVVKGTNPFPQYAKESLLVANPDHYVIATGGDRSDAKPTLPPPLNRLSAARKGNLHQIPGSLLFRPTPRLADGLLLLARALHG
jgi:iron complex transport system substrate-binding protein